MPEYKHGSRGDHIKEVQKDLLTLGFALPKFGADGDLGGETWRALEQFAGSIDWDLGPDDGLDECDDISGLVRELARLSGEEGVPGEYDGVTYRDVTGRYNKVVKGIRPWSQIDAIVLHQTGTARLPNKPEQWVTIPAHIGISKDGEVYVLHELQAYLWHANSFNKRSIGIEISGNFEGLHGKSWTHWKPGGGPDVLSDLQIKATRSAIRWIMERVGGRAAGIQYIFAHRQSNGIKAADPGQRVWQECGLWAQQELGLTDGGPGFVSGKGRPIPHEWAGTDSYKGYGYT